MKNKKPTYGTPVILPLGELAKGLGAPCSFGSVASGKCTEGPGVPPPNCFTGGRAVGNCNNGPKAANKL